MRVQSITPCMTQYTALPGDLQHEMLVRFSFVERLSVLPFSY